ncbi:hypothetical protein E6R61_05690 [Streptomyces sp. LRa12]|nr:hypothetical protein E6R61_05690 [Streptomyces sp. LRa12]
MRNLIVALLGWLLPSQGKRRAVSTAPAPTAPAPVRRPLPAPRSPRPVDVIDADRLPLVRPFLIAHERERERALQRERRTAATLATLGIDYLGVSA